MKFLVQAVVKYDLLVWFELLLLIIIQLVITLFILASYLMQFYAQLKSDNKPLVVCLCVFVCLPSALLLY